MTDEELDQIRQAIEQALHLREQLRRLYQIGTVNKRLPHPDAIEARLEAALAIVNQAIGEPT